MEEHFKFLGFKVRDKVTGLTGVGTSLCFDLYGCVQTAVTPPADDKGAMPETRWFDNSRLEFIENAEGNTGFDASRPETRALPIMQVPDFGIDKGPADKPSLERLPPPR